MGHLTTAELEARLGEVRESPADGGTLKLIVPRPDVDVRVVLAEGELNSEEGLAGDQLVVDLDIKEANLPAWTKLPVGDAVIEIADQPHSGCAKFTRRFGRDAQRFANSELGTAMKRRGVNARVVTPCRIRQGDTITKL
ncbi:MAG: MOSC domain-containing protein [Acidimicrobiaceae bacterium]|jgi:MOSC domain-containing protein YiiM|nr:MOSC domain-containing protein [Acidimicrobiaceae bacterium]MBT5581340.1 MOSC domain-containing protein [Acidimicrobiaceae bacterium]